MFFGVIIELVVEREYFVCVFSLIVEEYVCSEVWNFDVAESDNVFLLRVLMEGMGIIGEGFGKDYIWISVFLINVFCLLFDKFGEELFEVWDIVAFVLFKLV